MQKQCGKYSAKPGAYNQFGFTPTTYVSKRAQRDNGTTTLVLAILVAIVIIAITLIGCAL